MATGKPLIITGGVATLAGAITTIIGYNKYSESKSMLKTLTDGADLFGYTDSTFRSASAWSEHAINGRTILIIGSIILAVGLITLISGIVMTLSNSQPQNISSATDKSNKSVSDQLAELQQLKDARMITDDEYATKRKDIIDNL